MRKHSAFCLALLLAVVSVGCDSADDDPSHAEIFIGTWTLVGLEDDGGDKLSQFGQIANSFEATLEPDNDFVIDVDYKEELGFEDLTIPGTYSVNEDDRNLVLTVSGVGAPAFAYEIENDDRIELSANAAIVNTLFGSEAYEGTVFITIARD